MQRRRSLGVEKNRASDGNAQCNERTTARLLNASKISNFQ